MGISKIMSVQSVVIDPIIDVTLCDTFEQIEVEFDECMASHHYVG